MIVEPIVFVNMQRLHVHLGKYDILLFVLKTVP